MVHKNLPRDELENLAVNFKSEEIHYILQATKPSDWICDDDGTTLLHLAVVHNNINLIKYLLDYYDDINIANASGDTALLIAVKLNNFEAVKILLDADADLCVNDTLTGNTALEILMNKPRKSIEKIITPHLVNNLKKLNLETEVLVELLAASNCRLDYVLAFNDAEVSKKFLERNPLGIYSYDVQLVMDRGDFENVELIMRYGNKSARMKFYERLSIFMIRDRMDLWKDFIERLPNWNVDIREAAEELDYMLQFGRLEYVKILLDSKVVVQLREKCGIDLRTSIFGNRKVDAIELLRNEDFSVNSKGARQQTALHSAVKCDFIKNIRFLLDSGAYIDAEDDQGRTALFECVLWNSKKSIQLLLRHGADVQVANKDKLTVFELAESENSAILEFFIAQLAVSRVQGLPFKEMIQKQINSYKNQRKFLNSCCQQLEILKTCEILNVCTSEIMRPMTLFTVLTDKIETLCRFLCNRDIISVLNEYRNQHELHPFYYSTLKDKLIKSQKLYRFKCDLAEIISKSTGKFIHFDDIVVRKISKYLTQKDISDFLKHAVQL